MKTVQREELATRLGFLLVSAGCAIGLGNVWRFPYIAGKYGGLYFLGTYFLFLLMVGLPVLIMEFAIGRAARRNMGTAFITLEPKKPIWQKFAWFSIVGPFMLMMFYAPVASWLISYCFHTATGTLSVMSPDEIGTFFGQTLADPKTMYAWTLGVIAVSFGVCALGIQKGVERVIKVLMIGLLILIVVLAGHSLTLSGTAEGLNFYLAPNWNKVVDAGIWNMINDAMTQAFFTLSTGIGCMMIFGSYLRKENSLTGEAFFIVGIDTFVALVAGLIIFPACFTFGVDPGAGPALIFITLPNVFNEMAGGVFWGTLFFIFMGIAALTTVIAVIEVMVSYCTQVYKMSRPRAIVICAILLSILVLPCILGFSTWSSFQPFGPGSGVLDLEDFIISGNLLPIGSLIILLFCTSRYGWGFDKFVEEADQGTGMRFPAKKAIRFYLSYILPVVLVFIIIQGYIAKF